MKASQPAIILLVIFLLLGLAWDPIQKSNLNNPSSESSNPSTEPYTYPSDDNYPVSPSSIQTDPNRSAYYNKINLSYVAGVYDPDPSRQYISLFTNLDQSERVNVTGWKLMSERSGNWVRIGQANTLPKISSKSSDIILGQGDTLNIIKGFSPINISFRTNKCTGFFGEDRQFYPSIDRFCPTPTSEQLPRFSSDLDRDDECRALINRIPACTTPDTYMNLNRLPDTVTQSCKDYLRTKINYTTCVSGHLSDTDFQGNEWYLYLNLLGPLW